MDEWDRKEQTQNGAEFFLATVVSYSSTAGVKIRLDGQDEAMSKLYKRLYGTTYSAGQRVLVIKLSGTYIVIGRIA